MALQHSRSGDMEMSMKEMLYLFNIKFSDDCAHAWQVNGQLY